MSKIGDLRITLDLDDGQFNIKVQRAGVALQDFAGGLSGANKEMTGLQARFSSFGEKFRDFVVTAALIRGALTTIRQATLDWIGAIAEAGGKIDRLQALMIGFSGATTEAARSLEAAANVDFLKSMSREVPFAMDTLSNSFAKFKSVGIDPTKGSLDALTNAVSRFGGTDNELQRASVAITQMAGKGVISMEELRQQLGEAVPTAVQTMARALNFTTAELVKRVSLGQVEASSALKKFFVQLEMETAGSNARLMNTWTGMISRLKTEWLLLLDSIDKAGTGEAVRGALTRLIQVMQSPAAQRAAQNFGQALAATLNALVNLANLAAENWDKIAAVAKIVVAIGALRLLQGAIIGLGAAAGTIGVVGSTITAVTGAVVGLGGALAGTVGLVVALGGAFAPVGAAITGALGAMFGFAGATRAAVVAGGTAAGIFTSITAIVRGMGVALLATGGSIAAVALRAVGLGPMVAMFAAAGTALAQLPRLLGAVTGAIGMFGVASNATAVSVTALGVALRALLGPIALVLSVGAAVVSYFNAQREAAGELVDEINQTKGAFADLATVQKLQAEAKKRQDEEEEFRAQARMRAVRQGSAFTGKTFLDSDRAKLEEMEEATAEAYNAVATARESLENRSKDLFARREDEKLEKLLGNASIAYNDRVRKLEAERGTMEKAEFDRQKLALDGQYFDEQIAATEQALIEAQYNRELEKAKILAAEKDKLVTERRLPDGSKFVGTALDEVNQKIEAFDQAIAGFTKRGNDLRAAKDAALATLSSDNTLFTSKDDQTIKAINGLLEQTERRLQSLRGKLEAPGASGYLENITAQLSAMGVAANTADPKIRQIMENARAVEQAESTLKWSNAMGDLVGEVNKASDQMMGLSNSTSEWQAKLKDGTFGNVELISPEQLRSAQELISLLDALAGASKAVKDADQALKDITSATLGITDDLSTDAERNVARFNRDIAKYAEPLEKLNQKRKALADEIAVYELNSERRKLDRLKELSGAQSAAERERLEQRFADEDASNLRTIEAYASMGERKAELEDKFQEYVRARMEKLAVDNLTPMQKLALNWKDTLTQMQDQIVDWADRSTDSLVQFANTGKFAFGELTESILRDLLRLQIQQSITGPLFSALSTAVSGFLGGIGGPALSVGSQTGAINASIGNATAGSLNVLAGSAPQFAGGGIMTPAGEARIRQYRAGGIATEPQVSIFGEGDLPEAYVPLQDGRTIPVSIQGGIGRGESNVQVNVINQSGQPVNAQQGQPRFDGKSLVLDVVLTAMKTPGNFRDEMRGAVR